jgi:hypothetical protein
VDQRSKVKLFCVVVCFAGAVLCAINRAPVLAGSQFVAAIVVWRVRFGRRVQSADIDGFSDALNGAKLQSGNRGETILAAVFPDLIMAPIATSRNHRMTTSIMFRDEVPAIRWRQLSTLLRHQPRSQSRSTRSG